MSNITTVAIVAATVWSIGRRIDLRISRRDIVSAYVITQTKSNGMKLTIKLASEGLTNKKKDTSDTNAATNSRGIDACDAIVRNVCFMMCSLYYLIPIAKKSLVKVVILLKNRTSPSAINNLFVFRLD